MELAAVQTFLLDMDGTFYLGDRLLPGALEFIDFLMKNGKKFYFLTNNSSHNVNFYLKKLARLGLKNVSSRNIITSGQVCAYYIRKLSPRARVFLLGTQELAIDFMREGLLLVEENPDYVVLGFDKTLTYDKLRRAASFVRSGVPFLVTHPDLNCPTPQGPIIDAGSIMKAIEAATGVQARVFGKPYPETVFYVLERVGLSRHELAMVGDRLYTDMRMAKEAGIISILVLTGETCLSDLKDSPWKPDFVFSSLQELLENMKKTLTEDECANA